MDSLDGGRSLILHRQIATTMIQANGLDDQTRISESTKFVWLFLSSRSDVMDNLWMIWMDPD
jgi:hypothetical protein